MKEAITELKSLTRGHHIENNSAGNLKISGSLSGGIAHAMLYGKARKSAFDSEIEKMKKELSDFSRKVKNGKNSKSKLYKEERHHGKVKKLKIGVVTFIYHVDKRLRRWGILLFLYRFRTKEKI